MHSSPLFGRIVPLVLVVRGHQQIGPRSPFFAEKLVKWSLVGKVSGNTNNRVERGAQPRSDGGCFARSGREIVASVADATQKSQIQSLAIAGSGSDNTKKDARPFKGRAKLKGLLLSDP